jgi:amino acid permease
MGLAHSVLESRNGAIAFVGTTVILPLSLLKDMRLLARASILSVVADVTIALVVVFASLPGDKGSLNDQGMDGSRVVSAAFVSDITRSGGAPPMDWTLAKWGTAVEGMGTICLALVCQHTIFHVKDAMESPTPRRFAVVTWLSMSLCLLLCVSIALGGFSKFSNEASVWLK